VNALRLQCWCVRRSNVRYTTRNTAGDNGQVRMPGNVTGEKQSMTTHVQNACIDSSRCSSSGRDRLLGVNCIQAIGRILAYAACLCSVTVDEKLLPKIVILSFILSYEYIYNFGVIKIFISTIDDYGRFLQSVGPKTESSGDCFVHSHQKTDRPIVPIPNCDQADQRL